MMRVFWTGVKVRCPGGPSTLWRASPGCSCYCYPWIMRSGCLFHVTESCRGDSGEQMMRVSWTSRMRWLGHDGDGARGSSRSLSLSLPPAPRAMAVSYLSQSPIAPVSGSR